MGQKILNSPVGLSINHSKSANKLSEIAFLEKSKRRITPRFYFSGTACGWGQALISSLLSTEVRKPFHSPVAGFPLRWHETRFIPHSPQALQPLHLLQHYC